MKANNVYIIAGPNGSGKTTFAKEFLPKYAECTNFINADLIAQGVSPFSPERAALRAGKIVLQQIKEYAGNSADFGFETTLSGKTYLNVIKELKSKGYKVHLFFLWIPDYSLAIERIKGRVAEGGHFVPDEDVIRRFSRSNLNFINSYRTMADTWLLLIIREKNQN